MMGDVLRIQMPTDNVMTVVEMISYSYDTFAFDWTDDFGYTETTNKVMDGAARLITLLDGLLNFDGASWSIFSDWYAFDQKFGRELALMVCTESQDETQEKIEQIENSLAIFDPETPVGAYLKGKQVSLDEDLKAWDAVCKECLKIRRCKIWISL